MVLEVEEVTPRVLAPPGHRVNVLPRLEVERITVARLAELALENLVRHRLRDDGELLLESCLDEREAREGVGDEVLLARQVFDPHVALSECLEPPRLALREVLLCVERLERVVVREHRELDAEQFDAPRLDAVEDGQELLLVRRVVPLRRNELTRVPPDGAGRLPGLALEEDTAKPHVGRVRHEPDRRRPVAVVDRLERRELRDDLLDCLEVEERLVGPLAVEGEGRALLGERSEAGSVLGEYRYELAQVLYEAEEAAELLDRARHWPRADAVDLLGVDGDALAREDVAEESARLGDEVGLLG